ncbi:MAG: hypothetical protein ACFE9C_01530 [Candidatus Hodarchaeota archaeon]
MYYLWRQSNSYVLANWKDISYWFDALSNNASYNFLQEYYNTSRVRIETDYFYTHLNFEQLDVILDWIVNIRDNYVLDNIKN